MNEYDFGSGRAADFRHRKFWAVFRERHPDEEARRVRNGPWFWQRWSPGSLGRVQIATLCTELQVDS